MAKVIVSPSIDPELASIQSYLLKINELTLKSPADKTATSQAVQNPTYNFLLSPNLFYAVILIFFVIFGGALLLQFIYKILDFKRMMMTLVVAILIASSPLVLRSALEMTTLETKAAPEQTPKEVQVSQTSPTSIMVEWTTDTPKLGSVRIGPPPLSEKMSQVIIANNGELTTKHSIEITDIAKGEYEIEILSGKDWYLDKGQPLKISLE